MLDTVYFGPEGKEPITQERLSELETATKATLDSILTRCGATRQLMATLTTVAKAFELVRSLFVANTVCFFKGFGSHMARSGGTVDMTCPHLIPYAMLPVIFAESPGDVAALLAMMRHVPNVSLYDFVCGGQQALVNEFKRVGILLGNRVGAVMLEHEVKSLSRFLPLSVPALAIEACHSFRSTDSAIVVDGAPCLDVDRPSHPVSGSKVLLVMHDSFHGKAHKKCRARDTDLIKELRTLDTSRQEHRNRLRLQTDHFLRNHSPQRNMFFQLLIAHRLCRLQNEDALERVRDQLEQFRNLQPHIAWSLEVNCLGIVVIVGK